MSPVKGVGPKNFQQMFMQTLYIISAFTCPHLPSVNRGRMANFPAELTTCTEATK